MPDTENCGRIPRKIPKTWSAEVVVGGSASKGTKVVVFVRRNRLDAVRLVATTARAVVVEVGGCRVGGVYGKCGASVHAMEDWVGTLGGWVGGGDWVLLGDWNAHHHTWSLDRKSGPGGRVLAECYEPSPAST